MIPLGAMLMSFSAELLGVIETFIAMGVSTIVIALLFGLLSRQRKDGGNVI